MESDERGGKQRERAELAEAGLQGRLRSEGGLWSGGEGVEQDDGLDKVEQREE